MAELYITAITIAIIGVTWIRYLLDPDGLFNFFPNLLEQGLAFTKLSARLTDRLMWVFTQCEKCFAGQLALWAYVVMAIQGQSYDVIEHIILICLSIFFAGFINTLLRSME